MSRHNKVNPGMYTQRGRLTQDDAARELRKQSAVGSTDTWQPVKTQTGRRLAPTGDAAGETDRSADNETVVETSPPVEPRPASRKTRIRTATKAAPAEAKVKAAKAKTVKAKTARTTKPTRKAVLARRGAGAAPRATTKRRRS